VPKPPEKPLAYERDGRMPTIYIYTPEDGRPATWGNGTHVAFIADTRAQVHAFHEQALKLGGKSEGEPGPRPHYGPNYYAAYVRDPDGNKLQAVCYASAE
jgi:catechol 2,3-dioxygenase-like lactoylglutathione lyase family enzyme